jgi:broad specificity phosphatase PhoE
MGKLLGLKCLAGAVVCVLACLPSLGRAEDTVFFVVRHAEKVDESADPELSAAGKKRAELLAQTLEHLRVDAIYHTNFIRTTKTAAPLAQKRGITPEKYDNATQAWIDGVVVAQKGKRILIVGHSNTIGDIVHRLSGQAAPTIGDRYDNLFIVVISDTGMKAVVPLKYGDAH